MAAKKCPTGQILAAIFCPRTKIAVTGRLAKAAKVTLVFWT